MLTGKQTEIELKGTRSEKPTPRLDSQRYSLQNGPDESFPAPIATIFVNSLYFCFEGVSLRGLSGRSLGNLWEVSTISEKLSNILGRLQKAPGNVYFTMVFQGRCHKLLFFAIEKYWKTSGGTEHHPLAAFK